MQGAQQQDTCSSAGSERGRARAEPPALLSPGCPRSLSSLACLFCLPLLLVLPHARGSATAAGRFPPHLGPLLPRASSAPCSAPRLWRGTARCPRWEGGLLAPKPWGWRAQCVQPLSGHTGAPGPDCSTPEPLFWSEPCSSPLGAPRKLPSVRGAQGDRQGCCEHPMGTCADQLPPAMPSREKLRAGGEELELPARLAFSPSRHARQKQLTKTRGVNKNR